MKYPLSAYLTRSFWRHALFSWEPLSRILSVVGGFYLIIEALDFFQIFPREQHSRLTPPIGGERVLYDPKIWGRH